MTYQTIKDNIVPVPVQHIYSTCSHPSSYQCYVSIFCHATFMSYPDVQCTFWHPMMMLWVFHLTSLADVQSVLLCLILIRNVEVGLAEKSNSYVWKRLFRPLKSLIVLWRKSVICALTLFCFGPVMAAEPNKEVWMYLPYSSSWYVGEPWDSETVVIGICLLIDE